MSPVWLQPNPSASRSTAGKKQASAKASRRRCLENMASFVASEHLAGITFVPPAGPSGDNRLLSPDYKPMRTKDSYITVHPNTNAQAAAFFDVIGKAGTQDKTRASRMRRPGLNMRRNISKFAQQGLLQKTTEEWVEIFAEIDVPAARYNTIDGLLDDPHLNRCRLLRWK